MPAFTTFDKDFSVQQGSDKIIDNLPSTLSQDSIGQCAAWAATTMLQINNCRIKKQVCKDIPDEEKFSPLDVVRYGKKADGDISYESSYRGINLDGSSGGYAMEVAALHVGSAASQACLSLDKILSKLGGVDDYAQQSQIDALKDLETLYKKSQKIDKKCETCLSKFVETDAQGICQKFNLKNDPVRLAKAFSEDTFEKFLDDIFSPPECKRAKNRAYFEGKDSMQIGLFPKGKDSKKDKNYNSVMDKIKSVLDKKYPVMIQGICATETVTNKCKGKDKNGVEYNESHATVVVGYARMCNPAGKCYDALKLQNSWGETWQKATNGGWVSAEALLKNTPYEDEMLAWLEDKPEKTN
jgi:hypothetical protein